MTCRKRSSFDRDTHFLVRLDHNVLRHRTTCFAPNGVGISTTVHTERNDECNKFALCLMKIIGDFEHGRSTGTYEKK